MREGVSVWRLLVDIASFLVLQSALKRHASEEAGCLTHSLTGILFLRGNMPFTGSAKSVFLNVLAVIGTTGR